MGPMFRLDYKKQAEAYTMPFQHYHDYYEIYYLLAGERYYLLEDRLYRVYQGDLLFIPANMLHRTAESGTENHERIIIYFEKEFLEDLVPDLNESNLMRCFHCKIKAIRLKPSEQNFVENLLAKMRVEDKRQLPNSTLYQQLLLCELLIYANRLTEAQHESFFHPTSALDKKIHKVVQFIRANYSQPLSLKYIADQFFISPYYLSRVFKRVTGLTLTEYLNNVRIREAQRLLRESDLAVSEIAEKVGYENQTHFGRMFNRIARISALKYRKSVQEQN